MTFYQWIGDARDARRSGTLGIPLVGDLPPTPTGRQSEIGRAADNAVAKIRQGTQMATRRLEADHARLLEQIRQKDDKIVGLSGEEADILAREPVRLAVEAGLDGSVIVGKILDNKSQTFGFDAQTEKYVDMIEAGIVDPAKVVRTALQDAASVAGLLITTEAMVAEVPKEKPAMPMGGGGGGMGGMDF